MRIRIWNAFASNNSGSYVIVGSFPTEALAAEVAAELRELAIAQSAWKGKYDQPEQPQPSPLAAYAAKLGLAYEEGYDEWPEYSHRAHPEAWAVGHQVFLYADYTVTMPRVIGQAVYARGGRVETELDHAHHPIVAMFEIRFPWQTREKMDVPARVQELVDALCADDGALVASSVPFQAPAWQGATARLSPGFGEADLLVGAVFEDLATGFAAVSAAVAAVGATVRVRVSEAHHDRDVDALAVLRPCAPTTTRKLFDVVLEDTGPGLTGLAKVVAEIRGVSVSAAERRIQELPTVILETVTPTHAEKVAARLRAEEAAVTVRPSSLTRDA